jgi:hypothetical protein
LVNDENDLPLVAGLIEECHDAGGEIESVLVEELEQRALPSAHSSQVLIKVRWLLDVIRHLIGASPELGVRFPIDRSSPGGRAQFDWALAKATLCVADDNLMLSLDCPPQCRELIISFDLNPSNSG